MHFLKEEKLLKNKQKQLKNKEKQVEALKSLTEKELESVQRIFTENMRTEEIKNECMELKNGKIKLNKKI